MLSSKDLDMISNFGADPFPDLKFVLRIQIMLLWRLINWRTVDPCLDQRVILGKF
jgi:hypothetical protein